MLTQYKHNFSSDNEVKNVTIKISRAACSLDASELVWSASGTNYEGGSTIITGENYTTLTLENAKIQGCVSLWDVWCTDEPSFRVNIILVKNGCEDNGSGYEYEDGYGGEIIDNTIQDLIDELGQKYSDLADTIANNIAEGLEDTLRDAENKLNDAQNALDNARAVLSGYTNDIENARDLINSISAQTNQDIEDAKRAIQEALEGDIASAMETINGAASQLDELQETINDTRNRLENAEQSLLTLSADTGSISIDYDEIIGRISQEVGFSSITEDYINEMMTTIDAKLGQMVESAVSMNLSAGTLTEVYNRLDAMEGSIAREASRIDTVESSLTRVGDEINAQIGLIRQSAITLNEQAATKTEVYRELSSLSGLIDDYATYVDTVSGRVNEVQQTLDAVNATIVTSVEVVDAINSAITSIREEFSGEYATKDLVLSMIDAESGIVTTIREYLNGSEGKAILSGAVVDTVTSAVTNATRELEADIASIRDAVNAVDQLRAFSGNVTQQLSALDGRITNQATTIEGVSGLVTSAQTEINTLRGTISQELNRIDTVSATVTNIRTELNASAATLSQTISFGNTLSGELTTYKNEVNGRLGTIDENMSKFITSADVETQIGRYMDSDDARAVLSGSIVDIANSAVTAFSQDFNARLGTLETEIYSADTINGVIKSLKDEFNLSAGTISRTVAQLSGDSNVRFSTIEQSLGDINLLVSDEVSGVSKIAQLVLDVTEENDSQVYIKADKIILDGDTIAKAISAQTISLGQDKTKFFGNGSGWLANKNIVWNANGNVGIGGNVSSSAVTSKYIQFDTAGTISIFSTANTSNSNSAVTKFKNDGSGYLANKNIVWNTSGDLGIGGAKSGSTNPYDKGIVFQNNGNIEIRKTSTTSSQVTSVFDRSGSGYLASKNIVWDANGNLGIGSSTALGGALSSTTPSQKVTYFNQDGSGRLGGASGITWASDGTVTIGNNVDIKANLTVDGDTIAKAVSASTITLGSGATKFESDGSGYVANENISWTKDGDLNIKSLYAVNTITKINTLELNEHNDSWIGITSASPFYSKFQMYFSPNLLSNSSYSTTQKNNLRALGSELSGIEQTYATFFKLGENGIGNHIVIENTSSNNDTELLFDLPAYEVGTKGNMYIPKALATRGLVVFENDETTIDEDATAEKIAKYIKYANEWVGQTLTVTILNQKDENNIVNDVPIYFRGVLRSKDYVYNAGTYYKTYQSEGEDYSDDFDLFNSFSQPINSNSNESGYDGLFKYIYERSRFINSYNLNELMAYSMQFVCEEFFHPYYTLNGVCWRPVAIFPESGIMPDNSTLGWKVKQNLANDNVKGENNSSIFDYDDNFYKDGNAV